MGDASDDDAYEPFETAPDVSDAFGVIKGDGFGLDDTMPLLAAFAPDPGGAPPIQGFEDGQLVEFGEDPSFGHDLSFGHEPSFGQDMPHPAVAATDESAALVASGRQWPADDPRWQANTKQTLDHAKNLTRFAMSSLRDGARLKDETARKNQDQTGQVQTMIKKKITATQDLMRALEDRIESVEDSIRQTGECLLQVQRAHRSKWATLNVCEQRLELREGRPLQELCKDKAHDSLEHERQTLIESRQELADQGQSLKEALVALNDVKADLLKDLSHKRHGFRIDRSCLTARQQKNIGKYPMEDRERVVLPNVNQVIHYELPPSPKGTNRGTGDEHEAGRAEETKELLQRTVRLEEHAMRLCNESDAVMLHTKRECTRATAISQNSLSNRVKDMNDFRQRLEAQIVETDLAIKAMNQGIKKTQKRMQAHEVPLRMLDKQFDLRNSKVAREHIRDPVTDELEQHLEGVKKNVKSLNEKYKQNKDILSQLQASRAMLAEDFRYKSLAVKIDDACIKVTLRKAIELDRMDPRGGRCRQPSSKGRIRSFAGSGQPNLIMPLMA